MKYVLKRYTSTVLDVSINSVSYLKKNFFLQLCSTFGNGIYFSGDEVVLGSKSIIWVC